MCLNIVIKEIFSSRLIFYYITTKLKQNNLLLVFRILGISPIKITNIDAINRQFLIVWLFDHLYIYVYNRFCFIGGWDTWVSCHFVPIIRNKKKKHKNYNIKYVSNLNIT